MAVTPGHRYEKKWYFNRVSGSSTHANPAPKYRAGYNPRQALRQVSSIGKSAVLCSFSLKPSRSKRCVHMYARSMDWKRRQALDIGKEQPGLNIDEFMKFYQMVTTREELYLLMSQ